GLFPDGASPFGVLDMSGNVFEWCLNDYSKPEIIDGYSNGVTKVLRGGSFGYLQVSAACAVRYGSLPSIADLDCGFRVVVAPPISAL
ncbi:MAG: SUMF1/EgtB/PvdO family nonheme iron enzyme, partial [Anaerolineae bacterium]|nr:SUMF1/EgtB/PvdO family nonheme iron enzyme [Anaerolineae bacterium]